jgi:tetratricopeptide (TPR) repeat protein
VALQSERKFNDAERAYDEAIYMNRRLFGPNNLEGASYRNNLATLYKDLHEYDKAEQELLGVLALRRGMQGQDHPQVATELRILSEVYLREGRYREAESYGRQALEIDEKFFKENSQQVSLDIFDIGDALLLEVKYQNAETCSDRAVNILGVAIGAERVEYADALRRHGNAYMHLGKYSDAERQTLQCLEIFQRNVLADDPVLAITWDQSAYIYQGEYKCSEAVMALKNALGIAQKGLGPDDRLTKIIQSRLSALACRIWCDGMRRWITAAAREVRVRFRCRDCSGGRRAPYRLSAYDSPIFSSVETRQSPIGEIVSLLVSSGGYYDQMFRRTSFSIRALVVINDWEL